MSEIILLGILALIVIGPKELPDLARTLGRFINDLKRSTSDLTDELKEKARFDPEEYRRSISKPETPRGESNLETKQPKDTVNQLEFNFPNENPAEKKPEDDRK